MTDADRQLAWEARRGPQAAAAAVGAALLTLGGGIFSQLAIYDDYPSVGVVQALQPALGGLRDARVNPRTAGIAFLDDNAAKLILTSVLIGLGTLLLGTVLLYLLKCTRARRPELPAAFRYAAIAGPVLVAVFGIARQIVTASHAHDFVTGTDRSRDAIEAVQGGGAAVAVSSVALAGQLALAFAIVLIALNAMRVGLLTRFMGVLGVIVGVLFVIPIGSPLPIVQAFWLVALAALLAHRWPSVQPPAWVSGQAQPWPTQQELREARDASPGGATAPPADDAPAEPMRPPRPSSSKRRKKRR